MAGEAGVWSFGYGSNMDMAALQGKKGVRVLRHCAAVLRGYTLAFGMQGFSHVEPGFACLRKAEGEEVHGVAFCMAAESVAVLDKAEGNGTAYVKETVELAAYIGEQLEAFIYVNPRDTGANFLPSSRYLGVLCKGARQAGLQAEYIARLEQRPVYKSGLVEEVVAARRARDAGREGLRLVGREEVGEHVEELPWVSCLGLVLRCRGSHFRSHRGRDITGRMLLHFHGISMDSSDDGGAPPYPLLNKLTSAEVSSFCW